MPLLTQVRGGQDWWRVWQIPAAGPSNGPAASSFLVYVLFVDLHTYSLSVCWSFYRSVDIVVAIGIQLAAKFSPSKISRPYHRHRTTVTWIIERLLSYDYVQPYLSVHCTVSVSFIDSTTSSTSSYFIFRGLKLQCCNSSTYSVGRDMDPTKIMATLYMVKDQIEFRLVNLTLPKSLIVWTRQVPLRTVSFLPVDQCSNFTEYSDIWGNRSFYFFADHIMRSQMICVI